MAGTGTKRITELTEASTIQSGDFIAVDSNARGTKKVSTDTLATSAALTAETNARAGADEQMSERMDGVEEQTALIQNPTKTLSGALVSFTDGADMPMVACTAEITPKQSGTGTPSPDNVRPISGWESVSVNVSGKNLLDVDDFISGVDCGSDYFTGGRNAVTFDKQGTYTIKANNPSAGYLYARIKNADGTFGAFQPIIQNTTYTERTLTVTDGQALLLFDAISNTLATTKSNVSGWSVQIELGTTATAYEPYTATTTTTSLGRTVYGGTLDVVTGVLTVTHKGVVYDGSSDEAWGAETQAGIPSFYIRRQTDAKTLSDVNVENMLYSTFPFTKVWTVGECRLTANYYNFVVGSIVGISNVSEWKTWLSNNPVSYTYELATPQTYTLTGQEISTLLGDNNVWADSGDVEITYRRDISIVLENLENALSGSNSLNSMMMSAPTENTAEEPTEDEAEDDMR